MTTNTTLQLTAKTKLIYDSGRGPIPAGTKYIGVNLIHPTRGALLAMSCKDGEIVTANNLTITLTPEQEAIVIAWWDAVTTEAPVVGRSSKGFGETIDGKYYA